MWQFVLFLKCCAHLTISKLTSKTSHTSAWGEGSVGRCPPFCSVSFWKSEYLFGSEVPGIKGLFVAAVGWPNWTEVQGWHVTAFVTNYYRKLTCHTVTNHPNITFFGTYNRSTMSKNVTVVNCHNRRFVGWTLRLGQNVTWSIRGWMDRQGTHPYCLFYGLLPTSLLPVTMLAALHTGLPPDILTSCSGVLSVTILIALSSEVPFAIVLPATILTTVAVMQLCLPPS